MDDCISGTEGPELTRMTMDEIQCTVAKGGFSVKGFVVSGEDPPVELSDGKDIRRDRRAMSRLRSNLPKNFLHRIR